MIPLSASPLLRRFMPSSHIARLLSAQLFFFSVFVYHRAISWKCSWTVAIWMWANTASKLQYLSEARLHEKRWTSVHIFRAHKNRSQQQQQRLEWWKKIHKAPWNIKIIWKSACNNTKCYFHYASAACAPFTETAGRTLTMRLKL